MQTVEGVDRVLLLPKFQPFVNSAARKDPPSVARIVQHDQGTRARYPTSCVHVAPLVRLVYADELVCLCVCVSCALWAGPPAPRARRPGFRHSNLAIEAKIEEDFRAVAAAVAVLERYRAVYEFGKTWNKHAYGARTGTKRTDVCVSVVCVCVRASVFTCSFACVCAFLVTIR